MSETDRQSTIWYLARDGKQYGPVQDHEMRKLVELNQLVETDLVWSPAYTEWQPASVIISLFSQPPAPEPTAEVAPPPPTAPEPTVTEPAVTDPAAPTQPAQSAAPATFTTGTTPAADDRATFSQPSDLASRVDQSRQESAAASAASQAAAQSAAFQSGDPNRSSNPTGSTLGTVQDQFTGPQSAAQTETFRPSNRADASQSVSATRAPREMLASDFDDDDDVRGGNIIVKALVAACVIALVGVGGYFAYTERDQILAMVNKATDAAAPAVRANQSEGQARRQAAAPQTRQTETVAVARPASTRATPASSAVPKQYALLKTPMWARLKSAFPEWANERSIEVRQMQSAGRTDPQIQSFLVGAMVQLRRRYSNAALSASPTSIRSVASAFLANLRALTTHGPEACYAFISTGEANPKVIALTRDPKVGSALRKQMTVIVDAVVEGRATPKTYLPPRPSDYSVISAELTKMGWTTADMRLFGDPQALSKAAAPKVCQLVTDWFKAQLMVGDPQVQSRLLVQSLKNVVAG